MIPIRQKVIILITAMAFAGPTLAGEARWQCYDGIDNDNDGYIDEQDTDCGGIGGGSSPTNLSDFLNDLKNRIEDLETQVEQLQSGGGGTNDALNYMSVVDGKLRISNIDLQVLNGNVLIGTAGTGIGLHNLVIGTDNAWNGNYNVIVGANNVADSQRSFIHGAYHYAAYNVKNAALLGGEANLVDIDNGTITGGQENWVTNAPFATIVGGEGRYTTYLNEVIADGTGSGN